jgi:hypothetical protein
VTKKVVHRLPSPKPGVVQRFALKTPSGKTVADGRVDTGADITYLSEQTVCAVDGAAYKTHEGSVEVAGGGEIEGFAFSATLHSDGRTAHISAFAPLVRRDPATGAVHEIRETRNLIGEDFMRGAKAKLDYSKSGHEFSDASRQGSIGPFKKASPKDAKRIRTYIKAMCKRHPQK